MRKRQYGTQWRQHGGFSLFFDYVQDEKGRQSWRTRVYHNESGVETEFSSIEPHIWTNWILQRADLPVDVVPAHIAQDSHISPATVPPNLDQVSIVDVQIEPQSSSDVRNGRFVSAIHFAVSGANAQTLAADNTPYQIMVHAVDLGSGEMKHVTSERGQLRTGQSVHTHRLEQPIPDVRRYRLQTIVLIQSRPELMTIYRGPVIKVVP